MHSNIKVGTIVNIMKVYYDYSRRVEMSERKYDYYKSKGDKTEMMLAEIQLNKDRSKLREFLDYYI